jgi:hypothetical protein
MEVGEAGLQNTHARNYSMRAFPDNEEPMGRVGRKKATQIQRRAKTKNRHHAGHPANVPAYYSSNQPYRVGDWVCPECGFHLFKRKQKGGQTWCPNRGCKAPLSGRGATLTPRRKTKTEQL